MIPNLPRLEKNIAAADEPASVYGNRALQAIPDKPAG
jgi:hypothetical protein